MISIENFEETGLALDLLKDVPKDQDFKRITEQVEKMSQKLFSIMKSQHYQIFKEDDFSKRQQANSEVIVYATVVQIAILMILTIWQFISLKNAVKIN
jgi:hypothetical protein